MSGVNSNSPPHLKRRVRWGRVMIIIAIIILPILILFFLGVYALYPNLSVGKIPDLTVNHTEFLESQCNILLLGINDDHLRETWEPNRRSEAIIVASINHKEATIKLLSIPRDTKAYISGRKEPEKINLAYAYGGAKLAQATVEGLLEIPIQYYIAMDWQTFIKIIDILDGVDLYVENNMVYQDQYANLDINLKKGYQRLDGLKAGHYIRFCGDEFGDIGRVKRQQRFLKTLLQEVSGFDVILKLPALKEVIEQFVDTNMPVLVMVKTANTLKNFKPDTLKTEVLPGHFVAADDSGYWETDEKEVKEMVDRVFY